MGFLLTPLKAPFVPSLPTATSETYSSRNYIKTVPSGTNLPLIVCFHGGGGTGNNFRLNTLAFKTIPRRAICIYPNAETNSEFARTTWNAGDYFNTASAVDDLTWVQGVIGEVITDESVDTSKIYLYGHSNGGMFAHRYASESIRVPYTYTIAKAAMSSATVMHSETYSFSGDLLTINGTNDSVVPYNGDENYTSQADAVATFSPVATEEVIVTASLHTMASVKEYMLLEQLIPLEAKLIQFYGL